MPRLLLLGLLMTSLAASGADPSPAERAQTILNSGLDRITSLTADEEGGVWALTDGGRLLHCRRAGPDDEPRIRCIDRQGKLTKGY